MSAGGARVRTKARMQERAIDKAEAKLGEELRATKRQLQIKEKETQEIEKQAEERLKVQEMEARKAEKDLTKGHKRQLALMRGDLERTREEETRMQGELVRGVRQKKRQIAKEVEVTSRTWDKWQTKENCTCRCVWGGGAASTTSPAAIQNAITSLCGVHRVKTGKVTAYLDAVHDRKRVEAASRREMKRLEGNPYPNPNHNPEPKPKP